MSEHPYERSSRWNVRKTARLTLALYALVILAVVLLGVWFFAPVRSATPARPAPEPTSVAPVTPVHERFCRRVFPPDPIYPARIFHASCIPRSTYSSVYQMCGCVVSTRGAEGLIVTQIHMRCDENDCYLGESP